jgi:uncharacterized membrane protein
MVTRVAPVDPEHTDEPDWLSAGQLQLDDERTATVAFNRFGDGRLSLTLDGPVTVADLAAVELAAELLPHLTLGDLADPDAFRERHCRAFDLPRPLPRRRFNQVSELRLVAPAGGEAVPRHAGPFGLPVTLLHPPDPDPDPDTLLGVPGGPAAGDRVLAVAEVAGSAVGRGLGAIERGLVRVTRLDVDVLCALGLALAVAGFVGAFTWQTWANHERFGTYGFDLGIFDQGTWLLSQVQNPFVTIRGLNLFGDHASYILLLVAPLYRLWADPRLLLLLQVVALAVPAVVVYRLATWRLGHPGYGLALAVAYLAYPAMQWAVTWQFHPETLAAALLALAVLAAEEQRPRLMAVLLGVALLAKEDIGLIVAAYGVLLWVTGRGRWGRWVLAGGFGWFLLATFVLMPIVNGQGDPHLELKYGIEGSGPVAVLLALPELIGRMVVTAFSNEGVVYLALIFLPLALLPLLSWKALIPVAPPLLLNLAANVPYQHQINYHYVATSAPFLAIAAVGGLAVVAARRRALAAPAAVFLVVVALAMDFWFGPAIWSSRPGLGPAPAQTQARLEALATIPDDAAVSAQFNLVTHLAHRRLAYEFPNPFRAATWGLPGSEPDPADAERVQWLLVEPANINDDDKATLRELRASGDWNAVFERDGVLVLQRKAAGAGSVP